LLRQRRTCGQTITVPKPPYRLFTEAGLEVSLTSHRFSLRSSPPEGQQGIPSTSLTRPNGIEIPIVPRCAPRLEVVSVPFVDNVVFSAFAELKSR